MNITTLTTTCLSDTITPVGLYLKLRDQFHNSFLLESSDYHGNENNFSFICIKPLATFIANQNTIKTKILEKESQLTVNSKKDVTKHLQRFISGFNVEKNSKKVARLNQMQAQYESKVVASQVTNAVEDIKSQLTYLDKNLASVTTRYSLAKKTLKEYNKLYNRGRADLDQVIRAEESLISTEESFIQYKSKREKLFYALMDLYGELQEFVSK